MPSTRQPMWTPKEVIYEVARHPETPGHPLAQTDQHCFRALHVRRLQYEIHTEYLGSFIT